MKFAPTSPGEDREKRGGEGESRQVTLGTSGRDAAAHSYVSQLYFLYDPVFFGVVPIVDIYLIYVLYPMTL